MKKEIKIELTTWHTYDFDFENINDLIKELQEFIQTEYTRVSADAYIGQEYESPYFTLTFYGHRLENDQEYEDRLAKEQKEQLIKDRKNKEHEDYIKSEALRLGIKL